MRLERLESRLTPDITFAAVGDYGAAGQPEADVAALINGWNPDFVITQGDNNYTLGAAETIDANIGQYYHQYIGNYTGSYGAGSATNRFFPSLGNHDWYTTSGTPALPTPYLNYFTLPGNERYYTFTQGPVQFFVVDSALGDPNNPMEPDGISSSSVQAQWLQSQLAASTAPWKIVYFHHAPYSSSLHGSHAVMQWPFQAWGATAVLSGHDHSYERVEVGGLPYFVNGLGGQAIYGFNAPVAGSQLRYNGDYGAMRVTASNTHLQFQFFTRTGTLIDSHALDKAVTPVVVSLGLNDASAAEPGDAGSFQVTRTGPTTLPLTINYAVSGTATAGADFAALPGTITIPAGAASAAIPVSVLDDWLVEGSESVTLTLAPSSDYNRDASYSQSLVIVDNEVVSVPLIGTGSSWKYLDNGSDQGTAWTTAGFSDATWKAGNAQLGYGDGDEATVVSFGPSSTNKYITTYFRKSFAVADAAAVTALDLRLLRDDGAVVYINGVEAYRANMPAGTITATTLASAAVSGADESTFFSASLNPSLLQTGTNVIAVEIHQAAVDSSDISFDMDLKATVPQQLPPPSVVSVQTNGAATGQHSRVTNLVVTFSEPVTIANPASAFQLVRTSGGPAGTIGLSASQAGSAVTLTFTPGGTIPLEPGSSLPDGRYQLTVVATGVAGIGNYLDGSGNGKYDPLDPAGDNHVSTTWRLFGDANGDATVDSADFLAFRLTFLSTSPVFDADGDGQVGPNDFLQFRLRFLLTV
ncbi:MAG: metallophosphoesterase [Gemmataceae bacterium]|nr:metallophosphoesterase [Gemmataceae bacterium]